MFGQAGSYESLPVLELLLELLSTSQVAAGEAGGWGLSVLCITGGGE